MNGWEEANLETISSYRKKIADVWICDLIGFESDTIIRDYGCDSPVLSNRSTYDIKDISPIELKFFIAMVYFMETYGSFVCSEIAEDGFYTERHGKRFRIYSSPFTRKSEAWLYVKYQEPVGKYRIDFMLELCIDKLDKIQIALELDGHDFHEKTKQQASHDRKRDRDLLSVGISTIRFTGSDIHNDVEGCVKYTLSYLAKLITDNAGSN